MVFKIRRIRMRVTEPVHNPRRHDRILHRLVRLCFQITRKVQVGADRRCRVYEVLVHGADRLLPLCRLISEFALVQVFADLNPALDV